MTDTIRHDLDELADAEIDRQLGDLINRFPFGAAPEVVAWTPACEVPRGALEARLVARGFGVEWCEYGETDENGRGDPTTYRVRWRRLEHRR